MERSAKVSLMQLLRLLDLRFSARLVVLMVASALTEGIGLVLLVPMLGELGGGGKSGKIASWLAAIGVPTALGPLLIIFACLVLGRAIINHASAVAGLIFQSRVVDQLRGRAWNALVHCDWRVFSAMRQADATSLLISNIDRIGSAVQYMLAFLAFAITLAGVGTAALAISPVIALVSGCGGAIVLLAYRSMRRRAGVLGEQMNAAYNDIHQRLGEGMRAMRVIKSFGLEGDITQNGIASFTGLRRAQLAYARDLGYGQIALQGGGGALLAVGVWLAFTRTAATLGEILPLVALFARGLPLLGKVQESWQNWVHCSAAIDDTFALIAQAEAAREADPGSEPAPPLAQDLVFDAVSVQFAGSPRPALSSVSLRLKAGATLAVIGASGAGKSTLADLAGGLLAADAGAVRADGIVLEGALRRAWRSRVAYVQQDPVLFFGSVRDNLLCANPAADEARLRSALAHASAQFVDALPQGIDTVIGEGGRRLSGGEQQRIALARALLRDPALLILDEATSALDAGNERLVCEAIARLKGKLTIIIIGHRGELVALADRVIALDEGVLAEPRR